MSIVLGILSSAGAIASLWALGVRMKNRRREMERVYRFYAAPDCTSRRQIHRAGHEARQCTILEVLELSHEEIDRRESERIGKIWGSMERRREQRNTTVPSWALSLFTPEDARRYDCEGSAHLHQLVDEGQVVQARIDRRRLALSAIVLAIALRIRQRTNRIR
jgi:hypothetical protein